MTKRVFGSTYRSSMGYQSLVKPGMPEAQSALRWLHCNLQTESPLSCVTELTPVVCGSRRGYRPRLGRNSFVLLQRLRPISVGLY